MLGIAQRDPNNLAVAVVRPGIITSQVNVVRSIWGAALHLTNLVTNITVQEVAAAMLHQATNGFVKETLSNEDLKHIGREALAKQQS